METRTKKELNGKKKSERKVKEEKKGRQDGRKEATKEESKQARLVFPNYNTGGTHPTHPRGQSG